MHRAFAVPVLSLLAFLAACTSAPKQETTTVPPQQTSAAPATTADTSTSTSASKPLAEAANSMTKPFSPTPTPLAPVVVPAGTVITVRLSSPVGSKSSRTGDPFTASVAEPVSVDGKTVIPAGAAAQGTVVEAKAKGKIKGEARLKLVLDRITVGGNSYPIATALHLNVARGKGKRTAVATGGGAALGAIIGAIAGGGKGAAIGAGVGAGAGFAGGTFTGNSQIELPAESAVSFKLTEALTLK